MRILVTGASGFFGSRIVRRALNSGHTVVALGRTKSPRRLKDLLSSDALHYVSQDLSSPGTPDAIAALEPEGMVHAAAEGISRTTVRSRMDLWSGNITAAATILAFLRAKAHSDRVDRLVLRICAQLRAHPRRTSM